MNQYDLSIKSVPLKVDGKVMVMVSKRANTIKAKKLK